MLFILVKLSWKITAISLFVLVDYVFEVNYYITIRLLVLLEQMDWFYSIYVKISQMSAIYCTSLIKIRVTWTTIVLKQLDVSPVSFMNFDFIFCWHWLYYRFEDYFLCLFWLLDSLFWYALYLENRYRLYNRSRGELSTKWCGFNLTISLSCLSSQCLLLVLQSINTTSFKSRRTWHLGRYNSFSYPWIPQWSWHSRTYLLWQIKSLYEIFIFTCCIFQTGWDCLFELL